MCVRKVWRTGFNYLLISGQLTSVAYSITLNDFLFQLSFDFWVRVLGRWKGLPVLVRFQLSFDFWQLRQVNEVVSIVNCLFQLSFDFWIMRPLILAGPPKAGFQLSFDFWSVALSFR